MISNFHTHTYRCKHAAGEDREYVETAISRGLEILGFSDHSPYFFPNGYYSGYRMTPSQAPEYISSIEALEREYSDKIKIYIGYETEYYPEYFDRALKIMKNQRCDYLILGQHYLGNEIGQRASVVPSDSEEDLVNYVDTVITALKTGMFFYVAHPDVLNFTGDAEFYREQMTRLCRAAKEVSVPLELNLLGVREGRFYPNEEFWRVSATVGNDVIIGCDAHRPADVAEPENVKRGLEFARKFSLNVVEPKVPKFLI